MMQVIVRALWALVAVLGIAAGCWSALVALGHPEQARSVAEVVGGFGYASVAAAVTIAWMADS